MDQRQWKSLLQLLGVGSLVYGIYAVWADYRVLTGANAALNEFSRTLGVTETQNMFSQWMDGLGYGLGDMLLKSPWIWAGVLLILAPYLIGLRGYSSGGTLATSSTSDTAPLDLYVNCRQCGGAVRESAGFCPHCGATRS